MRTFAAKCKIDITMTEMNATEATEKKKSELH